jgi:tetratricopeptide (TPR) repeat protein
VGQVSIVQDVLRLALFLAPVVLVFLIVRYVMRRRPRGALPPSANKRVHAVMQQGDAAPGEQAPAPLSAPEPDDPKSLSEKIARAVAEHRTAALATLYVELARAQEQAGDLAAKMSALRSAAGYGALHGPPSAHAVARLALAEAAHQEGDLTSACEQWQLARAAFLESGDPERHAHVERRMRDNGCPTDWVLTDF